ncbi:MAG: hypothetical protein VW882_08360, partial [Gammaproteobacteria bacterium]
AVSESTEPAVSSANATINPADTPLNQPVSVQPRPAPVPEAKTQPESSAQIVVAEEKQSETTVLAKEDQSQAPAETADNTRSSAATDETPAATQEPATRVVKRNPNASKRIEAEQQYRAYTQDSTSTLSSSEYRTVLEIDPDFHRVRIEWLSSLIQSNESEFTEEASKAMTRWPSVYQYRQMLARLWVMSEPQKAYDLLVSDMPTIATAPDYHGLIAYSAQQMGDLNLASKKYQLLLQSYPERADWWLALGLLQEQLGNQSRALTAYQQSLRFPGLSGNTRAYAEQRVKAIQGF